MFPQYILKINFSQFDLPFDSAQSIFECTQFKARLSGVEANKYERTPVPERSRRAGYNLRFRKQCHLKLSNKTYENIF